MTAAMTDWGLSEQDSERLRCTLRDDERVVLVAKPCVRMHGDETFGVVLLGGLLAAFLGFVAYVFGESWWMAMLFFSPAWVLALVLLSTPLRYRWRMERTLYVLTDKRAVVFEQLSLWRNRCVCWPLFPGLVKKVTREGHDRGSLIFDYENRWTLKKRRVTPQPVGFLALPQPEQARQLVAEQVAAVPAETAPFAYRPTELRAPAPRLDAWGTPLARQPQEENPARTLLILGCAFTFFSSIALFMGMGYLREEIRLDKEGVQTTATVLRVRDEYRKDSHSYYPTLQFADTTGVTRTIEYPHATDDYPIGRQLSITYLPSDVETLRIEDGIISPAWSTLLGSGIFMLAGVAMLCGYKKWRKISK